MPSKTLANRRHGVVPLELSMNSVRGRVATSLITTALLALSGSAGTGVAAADIPDVAANDLAAMTAAEARALGDEKSQQPYTGKTGRKVG